MNAQSTNLAQLAIAARDNAVAPFSQFRVGAALLASDGTIFTGCNIENATLGLTICAERVALFKAISEGRRHFVKIAIATDAKLLVPPCGACRQLLWEFCSEVEVELVNLHGAMECKKIIDFLPMPFDHQYTQD